LQDSQISVHFSANQEGFIDRYLTTSEARQKFLNLVDEVEEGDQVIITKRGVPKAALDDVKRGKTLKLAGVPTVGKILTAARKKGLLRGRDDSVS
jgi:prevent-host-death family protein